MNKAKDFGTEEDKNNRMSSHDMKGKKKLHT